MRTAHTDLFLALINPEDPTSVVLGLGHGSCAEHEWGTTELRTLGNARTPLSIDAAIRNLYNDKPTDWDNSAQTLNHSRMTATPDQLQGVHFQTTIKVSPRTLSLPYNGMKQLTAAYCTLFKAAHNKKTVPSLSLPLSCLFISDNFLPWKTDERQKVQAVLATATRNGPLTVLNLKPAEFISTIAMMVPEAHVSSRYGYIADEQARLFFSSLKELLAYVGQNPLPSDQTEATIALQSIKNYLEKNGKSYMLQSYLEPRPNHFSSQWSSRNFAALAAGSQAILLNTFANEFANGRTFIGTRPSANPFSRAGLVFCCESALSPEDFTQCAETFAQTKALFERIEATGIIQALRSHNRGFYALSPSVRQDGTLQFFLNPHEQRQFNHGWYTVDELLQWTQNTGPVIKNKPPAPSSSLSA